jgi:hypothetical protein
MDTSMLAAGDVAATEGDMVATFGNKVSGGPDATQTTSTKQSRAHVPIGDGHLYLPGVSGNYASLSAGVDLGTQTEILIGVKVRTWSPSDSQSLIDQYPASLMVWLRSTGKLQLYFGTSASMQTASGIPSSAPLETVIKIVRDGTDASTEVFYKDHDGSYTSLGSATLGAVGAAPSGSGQAFNIGRWRTGNQKYADCSFQTLKITADSTVTLDLDMSDGDHKASSFDCSTGQTVTINTSGTDPATIVRKSFMRMDLVDDEYEFTTDSSAVNGTIVVATLEGTYSANISLNASTQYDLQARGVAPSTGNGFLKNVIGYLITPSQLSDSEITKIEAYFVDKGAAARSAFGSVTSFTSAWTSCNSLTSFPLIDTSSGIDFRNAWQNCSSLTSFPLIDTSSGTNFSQTWYNCTSLTSFPLINTSLGENFFYSWGNCSSLTSFPAINTSSATAMRLTWFGCTSLTSFPLLDTSLVQDFRNTWYNCSSLTSFPLIDTSSGTDLSNAWFGCSSLTTFPAINAPSVTDFYRAWRGCSSLTSFPLINPESALRFRETWYGCTSLTTFPANFFDNWSPPSLYSKTFDNAWYNCTSLTAQSVENILTSLDTSGVYGTNTGASGGTQLADNTIDIDYDGTTLSSSTSTAITSLKSKNWAISINSVIQ